MRNLNFIVSAHLGSMQTTKKIEIKAPTFHDAAQAWLNHKSNKDFANYNIIGGRHEGFDHEDQDQGDRLVFKVWRFTASDPWNLKHVVIWVKGFSHTV